MDRRFGRPLPCQLANPTRAHPIPPEFFTLYHAVLCAYAVLAAVSSCYPPVWGRLPTRYSPVRRSVTKASIRRDPLKRFARLACVKHAASVHPEPGSNSLNKSLFPIQDQPFLANPSLVYCFRFVQKIHSQLNVRGCVLLFSCQASVCCRHQRQLVYTSTVRRVCQQLFLNFLSVFLTDLFLLLKAFLLSEQTEKEGFEPSRRYKRPTPLAGAPLQPLEYFSNA